MEEFYYKMLDDQGNLMGLLTCSGRLGSDEYQVEIDAAEYAQLLIQLNGGRAASTGSEGGV